MNDKTKSYFNSVADQYTLSSNGGLWKIIRNNEKSLTLQMLSKTRYENILELGSGSGFYTYYLSSFSKNKVTCVDFSKKMLEQILIKNTRKINADIETFKDNKKNDLIFCAGAVEFTSKPQNIFQNASNMLSPSGELVILLPRNNFFGKLYKLFHKFNGIEVNLFSSSQIVKISSVYGLRVKKDSRVFPFSQCFCFGR